MESVGSSPELVTTSSAGNTPKLKLTLKLSEIRAATPPTIDSNETRMLLSVIPPYKSKKPIGRPRKDSSTAATTSTSSVPKSKSVGSKGKGGLTESDSAMEVVNIQRPVFDAAKRMKVSYKVKFSERAEIIKQMKQFGKVRRWRLDVCNLPLFSNRNLQVPCWNTQDQPRKPTTTLKTTGSGSGSKKFHPTFVCIQEGCHKIFDSKDKWRRHQNVHKRKEQTAVDEEHPLPTLKLNMGMIKAAVANGGGSLPATEPDSSLMPTSSMISSSLDPSEMDLVD